MVTILPKENDWSDAFQSIGQGVSQGYQNRSDEMALQKAIGGLGDNPTPRQILDAVTNTKTYNPASKQNLFKNYLGAAEFEELQRKNKANEEVAGLKNTLNEAKEKAKKDADINDALVLLDAADMEQAEKDILREKIKKGEASSEAIKHITKPNKEAIKAKEEEKAQEVTQKSYNRIAELIPQVGRSGILTSKLGGDTAKAYSEFTSLTGALEALLVEKVNRGTLSNTRFNYITETLLPKPSDSQADITGKLQGLATILELDPSALGSKEPGVSIMATEKDVPAQLFSNAKAYEGKTIKSPDGKKYFSDGEVWLRK